MKLTQSEYENESNSDSEFGRLKKKPKKQKKTKIGKGKAKPKQRETEMIEKLYWLSVIKYLNETSCQKLSWKYLKPDHYFTKMQVYFGGLRDKDQIKSLDERLKKKFLLNKNLDLIQAVSVALK